MSTDEAIEAVTKRFPELTRKDLSLRYKESQVKKWYKEVCFARNDLKLKGELDGSTWGIWKFTNKGRERLKQEWSSWQQSRKSVRKRRTHYQMAHPPTKLTRKGVHAPHKQAKRLAPELFGPEFEGVKKKYSIDFPIEARNHHGHNCERTPTSGRSGRVCHIKRPS